MKNSNREADLFREIVHKNNKFKRLNRKRRMFWIMILIILSYLLYTFFFTQTDPLELEEVIHWGLEAPEHLSK